MDTFRVSVPRICTGRSYLDNGTRLMPTVRLYAQLDSKHTGCRGPAIVDIPYITLNYVTRSLDMKTKPEIQSKRGILKLYE